MDRDYIKEMITRYKEMPLIDKLAYSQNPQWHTATELLLEEGEQQAQTIKELQDELQAKTEECDGLRVQVERLREALHHTLIAYEYDGVSMEHGSTVKEASCRCDETPAQSLAAHDNEVIERCAKEIESSEFYPDTGSYGIGYESGFRATAEAIRNLKTDPQLTEEE